MDLEVQVRQSAGEFSARAVNLSNEGMCIHTTASFHQGDQIEIAFRLPEGDQELNMLARVMWTLDMKQYEAWGCGVGILFEQVGLDVSESLSRYIAQCLQ